MTSQLALPHPYLETDNPQHFINLVPEVVRHAVYQIPHDWFELEEPQIIIKAYGPSGIPSDTDAMYRLNLWEAYNSKFESEKRITLKDITRSTSNAYFIKSVLASPERTLFLITEPTVTQSGVKYTHHLAMKTMIETLKMPILYNAKTGLPDTQLIATKQKIFEYIDQRMHGSIIQRQQISTTSKNVNLNIEAPHQAQIPKSIEDVDAEIKRLEAELASAPMPLPPANDYLPIDAVMEKVKTVMPSGLKPND